MQQFQDTASAEEQKKDQAEILEEDDIVEDSSDDECKTELQSSKGPTGRYQQAGSKIASFNQSPTSTVQSPTSTVHPAQDHSEVISLDSPTLADRPPEIIIIDD